MDYMQIADISYLKSYHSFYKHRMDYYSDIHHINYDMLTMKIFNNRLIENLLKLDLRQNAIITISQTKAKIIITTATKNRKDKIFTAYSKLLSQKGGVDWHWLIVDNGSDDGTLSAVSSWKDRRVSIVIYPEITGCAFPARNFAFDIVAAGLKNNPHNHHWILNIDSDDQLYNEYSLLEIFNLSKKAAQVKGNVSLAHGFAVWETRDENGKPITSSCPVNVDGRFPEVSKMSDIFERGLIVLAAIIPEESLSWLRYPAEFSFEDDALNQKIMLQGMKYHRPWIYTDYPIILKGYGDDTLINRNNNLGDLSKEAVIGVGHRVTGIRADIVNNLKLLRDFYVKSDL